MSAFVLLLTAVSTAAVPVEFDRRPYHTIIMKDKKVYTGQIVSEPGATSVRIRLARGQRLLPLSQIEKIIPPVSLEEAHDRVAATIPAGDYESWYEIARECLDKRPPLFERAVGDLGRSIAARETYAPPHLLLTRVLLRMGDTDGARAAAERFREVLPREPDAHLITGKLLAVLGEDPRDAFRAAIGLKPSVEAYMGLLRAEMSRGRFEEAREALAAAEALSPLSIETEAARGEMALAQGRLAEAEKVYGAALRRLGRNRKRPGADSARVGLASAYYLQGRLDEATRALLDADPTDPRVTYILALMKLGRERGAPGPPPAEPAQGDGPGTGADGGEGGGDGEEPGAAPRPLSESERLFALAAADGFAPAHLGLGTAAFLASGGDFSAALPHFERAAKGDRGDAYAALLTAWSRYWAGDRREAIADFMHVTVLAPSYAGGHAALAGATLSTGAAVEAVRLYRAGLENCPGDPGLAAGLGIAQLAAGDVTSAQASLDEAHTAGFKGFDLYLGLGYLAHVGGDNASAANWFTWALTAASLAGGGPSRATPGADGTGEVAPASGPVPADPGADTAAKYVKESLPRLYAEMGLRPSVFTFDQDGEPSDPLAADARAGPGVVARGGRLVFSGTQEREGKRTNVVLPVDGSLFRSASADFDLAPGNPTVAGLRLSSHTGAVEIARDPEAGIRVRYRDGQKAPFEGWRDFTEWPRGGRAKLAISLIETGKNLARVELRAQAAPPAKPESAATRVIELKKAFWRERALSVIIFAESPKGETVRAIVDNLVLLERQAR